MCVCVCVRVFVRVCVCVCFQYIHLPHSTQNLYYSLHVSSIVHVIEYSISGIVCALPLVQDITTRSHYLTLSPSLPVLIVENNWTVLHCFVVVGCPLYTLYTDTFMYMPNINPAYIAELPLIKIRTCILIDCCNFMSVICYRSLPCDRITTACVTLSKRVGTRNQRPGSLHSVSPKESALSNSQNSVPKTRASRTLIRRPSSHIPPNPWTPN